MPGRREPFTAGVMTVPLILKKMFMERGEAEKYINSYGAARMAYGTDYPLWDPVREVERFSQLKLTDDQFDQIFHKTAERILNL